MGFSLASAFVTIGADDKQVKKALSEVKKGVEGLRPAFDGLQRLAKGFLGLLTGLAAYAGKQWADEETAQNNLRSALRATGQEVDGNADRLIKFANHLQDITVYGNDAIESQIAFATNLGVTADQMEDVIKLGIGLGKAFFGGDANAGIEAAAKASQGNFKALAKMIPAIKDAGSQQAALNYVMRAGRAGFEQAQSDVTTFKGAMSQLSNSAGDAAKGFGAVFLPYLGKAAQMLRGVADRLANLSDVQRKSILQWTGYAAAVAGAVVLGPKVASFAVGVVKAFAGVAKILAGVSRMLVAVAVSPFGAVVAGLAGVATGFAYLVGAGDSAGAAVVDGFHRMWDAIKFVFENSATMGEAWRNFLGEAGFFIAEAWENAKGKMKNVWIELRDFMYGLWDDIGDYMVDVLIRAGAEAAKGVAKALNVASKATEHLFSGINRARITDDISQNEKGVAHLRQRVAENPNDPALAKSLKFYEDRLAASKAELAVEDNMHQQKLLQISDETKAKLDAIDKQKQADLNALANIHAAHGRAAMDRTAARAVEEEANRKSAAVAIEGIRKAKAAWESKQTTTFVSSEMKSLAAQAEQLFASLRTMTGVDEIQGTVQKIKDLAAGLGVGGKGKEGVGNVNVRRGLSDQIQGKGFEEAFKDNIKMRIAGMSALGAAQKRHSEAQGKRTQMVGQLGKLVTAAEKIVPKVEQMAMLGGLTALFAP